MMGEAIPFTVSGIHAGFAEAEGLIRLDDDELTLECETKDAVMGVLKSGVKEFHIPLSALDSVGYHKKLFGARLRIQANKMKTFDGFPGHRRGEIELRFARKDVPMAQELSKLITHKLKTKI